MLIKIRTIKEAQRFIKVVGNNSGGLVANIVPFYIVYNDKDKWYQYYFTTNKWVTLDEWELLENLS